MTWILVLWLSQGWQVAATGGAGAALVTATFEDEAACLSAMNTIHKVNASIGGGCFPSATVSHGR